MCPFCFSTMAMVVAGAASQCCLQSVAHLLLRGAPREPKCGIQLGVIVRLLQFLVPRQATYNTCMRLRPAREGRIP